jgi:two-component system, NarL family, response regulator NreC
MKPFRILLAEDHILFRELIKKSLGDIPHLEIVGEVSDGLQLLESIKVLKPHMIILDIGMPVMSGIEAARVIKKDHPEIKILLLTMYNSKDHLKHALEAKVDGYLLKENAFKDLVTAIETIRKDKLYISNIMSQRIIDFVVNESWSETLESDELSPREKEVLKYFAQGRSCKEIGSLLSISHSTVRNHITRIKRKLSMKKDIDMVKYAIKKGYASLST